MPADFPQAAWDDATRSDATELVRLALAEDLSSGVDLTTVVTADPNRPGAAEVVARESGVVAGLPIGPLVLEQAKADADWIAHVDDGTTVAPGQPVATLQGRGADLLTCERTILNFLGRLSGIASLTRRYVDRIAGGRARVYDTRKTTPGWRRLEKYAVRCGGGCNHRLGLSEAVLIKDNHLALSGSAGGDRDALTPADAVLGARRRLAEQRGNAAASAVVEVEVDTLDQLRLALSASPDIVLLDNMTCEQLREAVSLRDKAAVGVVLEASGGVNLDTVAAIAATGVDRISVGALTHSARVLDLGLDWRSA